MKPHLDLTRWAWLPLVVVIATGCGTGDEQLPTIADIRSDAPVDPASELPPSSGLLTVDRIDLPMDQPLDAAWSLVDEAFASSLRIGSWQNNGLRVGLLPVERLQGFVEALPPTAGVERRVLTVSDHPLALQRSAPLKHPVVVDLTVPPGAPRRTELRRGRINLQVRVGHDASDRLHLKMLPHHYVPRATLLPRDPLEKEADGRWFEELALAAHVPADRVLVLGLYWPWPEAARASAEAGSASIDPAEVGHPDVGSMLETEPAESAEDAPEAEPAPPAPGLVEQIESRPPPLANHLGRALFAGRKARKPLQVVLLISVDPIDAAPQPVVEAAPTTGE